MFIKIGEEYINTDTIVSIRPIKIITEETSTSITKEMYEWLKNHYKIYLLNEQSFTVSKELVDKIINEHKGLITDE